MGAWDQAGKVNGEGLLKDTEWRCFGAGETTVSTFKTPNGYCVATDHDGDRIVFRIMMESPLPVHDFQWSGVSITSTGKFAGIVASYKSSCVMGGMPSKYSMECDGEGTYKLP